ncbi:hypothetical protein [Commensalibacter oyaizuii]|uniref:Peptidase M6-like domain-containing protein n=1 Tax=Commensalibacter oyaizuii TaxID=3043873 RepID=A0ABT6Q023_9PROT|nr:hypothetical protein [Commensalibacter sp. TBRC 16381]MDI2090450.1 hypothetical protein [Commensalibacter sp. TBRC 16381]
MSSKDEQFGKFSQGKAWNTSSDNDCWKENFEGEVKFNSNIIYEKYVLGQQPGKRGKGEGNPIHYYMRIICNPSNNTSMWETGTGKGVEDRYVSIEMVFHILKEQNITNSDGLNVDDELIKSFELFREGVYKAWNNRYSLVITDHRKGKNCKNITLPILFALTATIDNTNTYDIRGSFQPNTPEYEGQIAKAQQNQESPIKLIYNWNESKWHYLIIHNKFEGYNPDGSEKRPFTDGIAMHVAKMDRNSYNPKDFPHFNAKEKLYAQQHGVIRNIPREILFAHEFGHMLGLPDEYSGDDRFNKTVQYYKPDGTLDSQQIDAPRVKPGDVEGATMMSSNVMKFPLRLGWAFGIGAQILLDKKSKKGDYSCDVILSHSK